MSAPFKVQAQAKANGETLKPKKGQANKKKTRKAAGTNTKKAKGDQQPQPQQEVIAHEPEAAGEDDHAFFDDEENADYAKFMLSLDSSELTTFSKRAKDRVAVAPTSKKKSKQQSKPNLAGEAEPSSQREGEATATGPSDGTPAVLKSASPPVIAEENPLSESSAPPVTKTPRSKEAVVDAKRRKASTTGWVVEESGPQRLPIKTRRGVLKPNERMQQQPQDTVVDHESTQDGHNLVVEVAENGVDQGEAMQTEEQSVQQGDVTDMMSDGEASVYDSAADSELEDYAMDELDHKEDGAKAANGSIGGGGAVGAGGGVGGGSSVGKVDLAVLRQRRFGQKKALIAVLCESILGAPEESLTRPKSVTKGEDERSRMEQLFALVSVSSVVCCLPLPTCSLLPAVSTCLLKPPRFVSPFRWQFDSLRIF